jgi:hypothetical protein
MAISRSFMAVLIEISVNKTGAGGDSVLSTDPWHIAEPLEPIINKITNRRFFIIVEYYLKVTTGF